jgi:hypothetical protein
MRTHPILLVSLVACPRAVPPSPPPQAPAPPPMTPHVLPGPLLQPSYPVGAIAPDSEPGPPCALSLDLTATVVGDTLRLEATATNRGAVDLRHDIHHACPGTVIAVDGLGEGYDLGHFCNVGACFSPVSFRTLSLAPGATEPLYAVDLPIRGDDCRPPIAPGEHDLLLRPTWQRAGPQPVMCGMTFPTVHIPDIGQIPPAPPRIDPARPDDCPPPRACALACPNGPPVTRDARGCSTCACPEDPFRYLTE